VTFASSLVKERLPLEGEYESGWIEEAREVAGKAKVKLPLRSHDAA
jgi:hypothetical protein